ncbi:uncharacterized protein LOC119085782 [Bradysia coprophila]|uniref:uncharacterized protein LOC119085782 n=1 Tax=Bradysia coprophila TaxID=38358 RepID=UPI00187D9828|nr:uncharacterized protein LOC119085782 [Bradysia coprophila]
MLVFQFSLLFVIFSLTGCECDTYRIGCRRNGDKLITKKVLISVPTSSSSDHIIVYEYVATKFVSFIEYQIGSGCHEEKVLAEIVFTGNYSLESKFFLYNVTKLLVTLVVYGFEQYNVPSDFQPILVPQFLITEDDDTPKFGVGFRQPNDELLYFQTQSSIKTKYLTNHTLDFIAEVDHFITYVSFTVDSKTAGATFLKMSEHNFAGSVYDVDTMLLTAKMFVYGFKRDNVPADYKPIFQANKVESADQKAYIDSLPFYSVVNESRDDVDFSNSNSQLDKYVLSMWIFSVSVRLMYTNIWI